MKKAGKRTSGKSVEALLDKHACPVAFHEVRTRFLGNIATPAASASPLQIIKNLWGGELPPFDRLDAVNELLDILIQGLWNDLTRHQKRSEPFRLTRLTPEPTAAALGRYGMVRLEELDGFIEGLFNGESHLDLPERAHEAVDHLAQMRAMMVGICELVMRTPDLDDPVQFQSIFRHLRDLTRIMETEIHEALLSCTRARRQLIESIATEKPTIH